MKKHPSSVIRAFAAIATAGVISMNAQAQCNIYMGLSQQTIDGFGFSSAWCGQLSSAKNNALYNTLGMSLLRIRIDPTQDWSEETANAAAAHAAGVKVLGTPWSPPASMKDNTNVVHGSLLASQYGNYASYLNQAVSSIGLDYVSIQNEPDWDPDYEGCTWTGAQMETFCANNAQVITKSVVMPESLGFYDSMSDPTLNDSTAASHVSIVAGHFYGNGNYVHTNVLNHAKHVWMTEHYVDDAETNMVNCITIAKEISDAMNNQFSAYFWWWVADYSSVNLVDSSGNIFKNGYTIGQFAKWIRPGSTRVPSDYNPQSGVYVTAYSVNIGAVIVAVNTNTYSVSQQFIIQNGDAATMEGYRTSSSEGMADIGSFDVSNASFTANLSAQSVTTFVQSSRSGGTYKIISLNSGKALDAFGGGTANGTQIQQWTYLAGANQQWIVNNVGSNLYSIIGVGSGKCIDVNNWGTANGTKVQLWNYTGGSNQKFAFNPTTNGYYEISPSHAPGSCLDVSGASTSDGANVQLWQWLNGNNQQWLVQPVDGTVKLISQNSGKAMDASGYGTTNGTQIWQWTYESGSNQKWTLTDTGNGYYKIIGVASGRSLDIDYSSGGTANGTKVQLWDYWNGPSQQFQFISTGVGQFRISPNCAPGSCLDVNGASTANGAVVQLWQWLNQGNQKWSVQAP